MTPRQGLSEEEDEGVHASVHSCTSSLRLGRAEAAVDAPGTRSTLPPGFTRQLGGKARRPLRLKVPEGEAGMKPGDELVQLF